MVESLNWREVDKLGEIKVKINVFLRLYLVYFNGP